MKRYWSYPKQFKLLKTLTNILMNDYLYLFIGMHIQCNPRCGLLHARILHANVNTRSLTMFNALVVIWVNPLQHFPRLCSFYQQIYYTTGVYSPFVRQWINNVLIIHCYTFRQPFYYISHHSVLNQKDNYVCSLIFK